MRSYSARRGRLSGLARSRLDTLLPGRAVPPGPVSSLPAGHPGSVVVEVGCGYGDAAVGYAVSHPRDALVALDVYPQGLASLAAAADAAGAANVWIGRGDAVLFLDERCGAGEIAAVHLFFPDPWPKPKHHKRRWLSRHTLDILDRVLRPDGVLRVATDQSSYAAWVRRQVGAHGVFEVRDTARPVWRPVAGYEAKALAAGRAITDLEVTRRPVMS